MFPETTDPAHTVNTLINQGAKAGIKNIQLVPFSCPIWHWTKVMKMCLTLQLIPGGADNQLSRAALAEIGS